MLEELRGSRASELPAEDAADLDLHLQSCPTCQRLVEIERKLDAPIAKAMRAVPVPLGLKSRILDQLATQRGAMHRRRFFYAAAAAACVVAAVGLLVWKPYSRAAFDLNEIVLNADRSVENPNSQVDSWLSAKGIVYQPPVAFDPHLLAFYGMTTIQGRQVPTLCYRSERNDFAQVYIIREADFDLSNLPESYNGGSSPYGHQLMVFRDKQNKQAYVVLFKGDSLDPFLIHSQAT
jgi:anti-sigma factor RsiW